MKQAVFSGEVYPAVRQQKHQESLVKLCQMISGCASSAAAYLPELPAGDESANFFSWLLTWQDGYLEEKGGIEQLLAQHFAKVFKVNTPGKAA